MAKSKISAGLIGQVGWIGVQTGKNFINDYSSNITQFAEDAKSVLNDLKQGKTKVVDAVNDIKANGGKKIADWFYDRSEATDGYDYTDNSDSDFDAGYQVGDDGEEEVDQTPSKVLDEDSMKNIAGGQINAMYQIGAKQAEASMINAASISTTIDKGVASIVTAINNVNSSIASIGEKIDMITKVLVSQEEQEEMSKSDANGMFGSDGRVTLGSWWNNIKTQANSGMDTVKTFLPMLMGSPADMLKEIIDFTGFRDKDLSKGIRTVTDKLGIDENEDRFINRLAEKLKGQTINTVGNDINEGFGDKLHNFLGGNAMPKFLNDALDKGGFVGSFIKDMIASSAGLRRNETLRDGSSASSEYNRDTAKFDNMVRTSIVEVIPDYLKIIAKGVTGKEYNVSIAGHVTAQTKDERQREINNLMDYSAGNGGVFSYDLSKNITSSFTAAGSRGKGYGAENMSRGDLNKAFEDFPMDTARDQFGILAAFYFGDKLQHIAAFNNQLDDKFWNWLKQELPEQMKIATGDEGYIGAKQWMCLYYVDTVRNALEGSQKGVVSGVNYEIKNFLANINQKASSIISSNNAAAKLAESFGRGDEYKAVTTKDFAQKYKADEKDRATENELEKIKEDLYKQVRDEFLEKKNISSDDFESWRYKNSHSKEALNYNAYKKQIDNAYQDRLLTEKASISSIENGEQLTIDKLEKAFKKSLEDASQVRTKEFDLDEDTLFPKFAKDVVSLLTNIEKNTHGMRPVETRPGILLSGGGDIPPVNNIWGSGDSSADKTDDDTIQAVTLGLQAKLQNNDNLDMAELGAGQQAVNGSMKDKARGNKLIQTFRKFSLANKSNEDKKEASGESSKGGILSLFKGGGLLGLITKGAGTILKGIGSVIVKFVAKPLLNFVLKGFKSGMRDITSGVKTMFGFGEENKEAAKAEAITVTIPKKIEELLGFFKKKDEKDDAREAAKAEKAKKKEDEQKAKDQKKQEAEERKVKKQYDKMQGMTEEQRTRLQQQWEHAANNENASEATRKKAQEKLALINAANKFDNEAYEKKQKQQKYERTRDRLQAYRDDESKSKEFRDRAKTRLRQINAQDFGNRFGDELKRAQEQQAQVLQNITNTLKTKFPTFSKVFSKLSKAAKKARTAIGSTFTRVVKSAGKALKGILHPVKSIGEAFKMAGKGIKEGFGKLKEGFAQGKENIKAATEQYKKLSAANGGGFKGGAIALAAAAGAGFNKIKDKIASRKNETEEEKQARKEQSRAALGKVGNVFKGTGKILLGISKMIMTAVMSMAAIKTLITSIKNVFSKSMKKMEPAINKIVKIIQPLVGKIGSVVSKLAKGLSKMVTSMQGVFKVLVNSIGKVLDSLMTALEPVMEAIIKFATPLQALIAGLMPVIEVLIDVGGSVLTSIVDVATGILTSLMPLIENVICPAIQVIAGVIQVISGGIQSVIGILETGLGHIIKGIGLITEKYKTDKTLTDTGQGLIDAGTDAMEGGVEQVERGKQTIKDALSGNPKTEEASTDEEETSSSTTYDSKLPALNNPNGAAVDTLGSGDETPSVQSTGSDGSELPSIEGGSGGTVYGQIGEMLGGIGLLLSKIAEPINETIAPGVKGEWEVYQEPMLSAMNKIYKDILQPGLETIAKIAGKQVEIASDVLIPTMATQKVDIKNDLEESITQQKMTQGIVQNVGGNIIAAQGLLLAAAGQQAAGNMLYQTAAGLAAQGMTTTTEGIQQHVNVNSKLLTGKYFNLSQLYPDDPYQGYGASTEEPVNEVESEEPVEEQTEQVTPQEIPQVVTSTNAYREFYERGASGSGDSQGSYGSYLNMSQRGCGPVALADAANRRGGHVNAGALAGSMASSGNYSSSRGTSVGGFLSTAASMGMGYQVGGVSAGSLRRASANNPVTLVGSGAGFGTRSGNTHFVNVVGTDRSGGAYVSNPMSGRVERRSANDLVSGSVLGLYGSGDIGSIPAGLFGLYGNGNITQNEFNDTSATSFSSYWYFNRSRWGALGSYPSLNWGTLSSNTQFSAISDDYHRWVNDRKKANQRAADVEYHKTHVTTGTTSASTQKYLWTADQAYRFYKNYMKSSSNVSYLVNYYLKSHSSGLVTDQQSFSTAMENDRSGVRSWVASILSIMGLNPKDSSSWNGWPDKLITLYRQYLSTHGLSDATIENGSTTISGQDMARQQNANYAAAQANLNRNKNTTSSSTITLSEATLWLNRIRNSSSTSATYAKINERYEAFNKEESARNKTGSSVYSLNMWWYKNALLIWDAMYVSTKRDQYTNTFQKWYNSLSDKTTGGADSNAIFMTKKGKCWKSIAESIANGTDYLKQDIDTLEAAETADASASSYGGTTSTVDVPATFYAATNPGGFTGYISTEAKYTPGEATVEAPETGSSFADRFKSMMSGLTNIWTNIMNIFSLNDKSEAEQAVEDAEEDKKERSIREKIGNEEYEQYEDAAWQAYAQSKPQEQGESDETYQTRLKNGWTDRVKKKWMNKLAGEQANMIDALRYNSLSDVQEGAGSTIWGGYNQETGMWEGGAWTAMGSATGNANSNVSSYNDPLAGKFVSDGGVIMWTDKYVPEITSTNITENGGTSQSQSPIHEFFEKTAGLDSGSDPEYSFSNDGNWYTMRNNPNTEGVGSSGEEHKGVDIKMYPKDYMVSGKSELHAITGGKITDVRFAGKGNPDSPYSTTDDGGWGNSVEFTDAAGYRHRYAHMRDNPTVKIGDTLNGGETLGVIGNTGDSSGEHLHYQINDPSGSGIVNPLTYFKYHQPTTGGGATQGAVSYEGITQAHDVWDAYQKRYADKWPGVIQDAYNNGMTPAETATILSTSIWEDGAKKVVGEKSLTATTYDGKGQRADGIMNWVSKDFKGNTVGEQMNYMKRRYFMDTPMDGFEYNGKYRKTSEHNQDINAFKEMTGRAGYILSVDSRYGPILNTDLIEGSSHFYQLDLAPSKSHTANGLADYVGTAIGAYNWMLSNGYGSLNPSSYQNNGTTNGTTTDTVDPSQIGQGTGAGNEDWTDTEGNKRTIWAYLTNTLGFSKEGAAGAMGNMYAESHYSPYALLNHETDSYSIDYAKKVNETGKFPSNDPYGVVQWLGDRRTKLLTHAKSSNASIADLPMQLSFLGNELSGSYKDVNSNMKGANDVKTASDYWQQHFEVCGEATDKRRKAAQDAYAQFKDATNLDMSSYGTNGGTTGAVTDLNNTLWINTLNRVIHETDIEGLHDYSQSPHNITLDGKTLHGRPDCTGMFKYAIDYLGYDPDNIQSHTLVSAAMASEHPIKKDGQPSEDFTAYQFSKVGKEGIRPGDILVENGHGEVGYGLVGSNIKGWNFGSTDYIKWTQAAAAKMLNGESVDSVMQGENISNMSTPTYVIRPSGQLAVPVAGASGTGTGAGFGGGVGMNIGKFNTAMNSVSGRYGQTGLYRNSYGKTTSFGNYAFGAMGGYANFVNPTTVGTMSGGSSFAGNAGPTSTMISGTGTLPPGKGINITGITQTAQPKASEAGAEFSSSGLATQMNVPADQKEQKRTRPGKPTKVTWHTWADGGGSTDPEVLVGPDYWAAPDRQCSVNYGISDNGVIKQDIDEGYGSWTSSSPENDKQAVTLEIGNSAGAKKMGEEWPISDAAMQSAINLTYDIAKRNGIQQFNFTRKNAKPYNNPDGADGNWTYHRMFSNKSCPGDYIYDRTNDILNVINGALASSNGTQNTATALSNVIASGDVDIPDIDTSKIEPYMTDGSDSSIHGGYDTETGTWNGGLFDEQQQSTTNNIVVNKIDYDQNDMMDRLLNNTFNVRALQVETLLETIIEKMDGMSTKNEQSVTTSVTQPQPSLFPTDEIPTQVQRLAKG